MDGRPQWHSWVGSAYRYDAEEPGMQQESRASSKGLAVPGTQHLLLSAAGWHVSS